MAHRLGAIRRVVADMVRTHLVTVVAGLSVVVGVTWARVEAVAAPPAPQSQRDVRVDGLCLASPVAKRPCGSRADTSSSSSARRVVKAPVPLPPREGWMTDVPFVPVGLAAAPRWSGPGHLVPPGPEVGVGAWVAVPAGPVTLAAWTGSVRPVPRGIRSERESQHAAAPVRAVAAVRGPAPTRPGPVYVQVGAYRETANAEGAAALLSALGYGVGARTAGGGAIRAIAAGPFASESEAQAAAARLREAGFAGAYVAR